MENHRQMEDQLLALPQFWPVAAVYAGQHIMSEDGFCWCQPHAQEVLPFGGLVVHRHFMDRPEYTPEEATNAKVS